MSTQKYSELWLRTWEEYLRLTTDYYRALTTLGLEFSQKLFTPVAENGGAPAASASNGEVTLIGPPGSTPAKAFLVANKTERPAFMSFEQSEFVSADGTEKLRVQAELTPASFELASRADCTVECRLPLTSEFAPGKDYRALLRVIGLPNMQMALHARVETPAA
ncbi:MAG TPA: hypothetical protein VG095_11010 [Chthoniobacterales bacterium]|nr:hypothetical protein [Chthoniobacterales bacterium]